MTWRAILSTSAIVAPITAVSLDVFGYIAKVEGVSMQPTLNPQGNSDYIFLNRWAIRNYEFSRGDVVSLIAPNNPKQKIIKRIVALEGDTIKTISYKNRTVTVPRGHCWIEGDNRDHSLDSNYYGPVALGLITAKARRIIWPISRWKEIDLKNSVGRDRLTIPFENDNDNELDDD